MSTKLLLALRDPTLANALCSRITRDSGGDILGESVGFSSVLRRAVALRPDVLVLEHAPREEEGTWAVLEEMERRSPCTRVLLVCDVCTGLTIIALARRGARGCLSLTAPGLWVKAVKAVQHGEAWFGRTALLEALCSQVSTERACIPAVEGNEMLTAREREVMALAGTAMNNKEIALELNISEKTVKTHLHRIYVKLQKSGRYKLFLPNVVSSKVIASRRRVPVSTS
jgi:DNA-binding NarL/FixJ family response regulator